MLNYIHNYICYFIILFTINNIIFCYDNPTDLFIKGSYRYCINSILNSNKLTEYDIFLLARSYQELKDENNAIEYFNKIDLNYNEFDNETKLIFYYYFIKSFYNIFTKNSNISNTSYYEKISNIFYNFPETHYYFNDIAKIYLSILWKLKQTNEILNINSKNKIINDIKSYILIINNISYPISNLFLNNSITINEFILIDVITNLDKKIFNRLNKTQLENIINLLMKNKILSDIKNLLNIYISKYKDYNYYYLNLYYFYYLNGEKEKAYQKFEKLIFSTNCSYNIIEKYFNILKKENNYKKIYNLINKLSLSKYPGLTDYYIQSLYKLDKIEQLYKFYKNNYHKIDFNKKYTFKIFRLILRNNYNLAKNIIDLNYSKNSKNTTIKYLKALFLMNEGNYKEAYKEFLDITLKSDISYEWVISKYYENNLRTNFTNIFIKKINDLTNSINQMSIEEIAFLKHTLAEIYPDIKININPKEYTDFINNNVIKLIENKEFNPEFIDIRKYNTSIFKLILKEKLKYYENKIKDNFTKIVFTYQNREIYKILGLQGYVVSRLNNYYSSKYYSRKYQILLQKEFLKELYPLFEEEYITNFINIDNDLFYWLLSMFREESHFVKESKSIVGAIGISQLMPYTAKTLAQNINETYLTPYDTYDNIRLGIIFFKYLNKKYKGNIYYTLAAYNAGEGIVNKWRKKYNFIDELLVEAIEYEETRNYIKRITLTKYFYDFIYKNN